MVQTFDISNLDYSIYAYNSLKYLRSTTLDYKDIEIRKNSTPFKNIDLNLSLTKTAKKLNFNLTTIKTMF